MGQTDVVAACEQPGDQRQAIDAAEYPAGSAAQGAQPDAAALLAQGDRKAAITALMDEHGEQVFGFCARILRDRTLAEDVLQQVYLDAYRDIGRFQGRSSLRTWLLRIASNRCQDALRSRGRQEKLIDPGAESTADYLDQSPTLTERLEQSRLAAALDECLKELSDEVRMTVLARFQTTMSYDELSEQMRVRPAALHARVARALPVLKRCLEGKGWRNV